MNEEVNTNNSLNFIVLWAQRSNVSDKSKNIIYLTINVKDPEQSTLVFDISDTSLDLKAKSTTTEEEYDLHIDFFKEIEASSVRQTITGSHIFVVLEKKDLEEEYWPRLTKDKIKYRNIRTDFDRWVDEDEQDEVEAEDLSGMGGMADMAGMGGMGDMAGLGGMGGMGDFDISQLAKQFGGAGAPNFGSSGPSQYGDFSGADENDFSSSGNEDDDEDDDEGHEHGHSHSHGDEGHSHSH